MTAHGRVSTEEAARVGELIGIDWSSANFDVEQFRAGMDVELEHGVHDPATDVTGDDLHYVTLGSMFVTNGTALCGSPSRESAYRALERAKNAGCRVVLIGPGQNEFLGQGRQRSAVANAKPAGQ